MPLLGYIFNLELQILNLIFLVLFIYLIYRHLRNYQSIIDTIVFCLSLSATMVIQFHMNFGAYPDILSYVLLVLVLTNRKHHFLPYVYFFLALLTKETVVFTILFFLALKEISKFKILLVTSIYLPIYFFLSTGVYGINHYIEPLSNNFFYWINQSKEYFFLGYFSTIKFLWVFIFLFILQRFKQSIPVLMLIIGISFQFIFGGDTTRFISFIFLGLIFIIENLNLGNLKKLNFVILLMNIITLKYYIFAYGQLLIVNESRLSFFDIYSFLNF